MKFGSATTSLPITTPLILKWQRRWLLTVHYGTGRQRMLHVARAQTSTSVELEGKGVGTHSFQHAFAIACSDLWFPHADNEEE